MSRVRSGMRAVTRTKRSAAVTAFKLAVSGSLIYWIFRGIDLGEVLVALRHANVGFLLLALALNSGAVTYLRARRWRSLLRAQGVSADTWFLFKSYMASYMFSSFLPSTIGGDIVRVYDSWRLAGRGVVAVTTVIVDRLLGILALVLLAVAVLPFSTRVGTAIPYLGVWTASGAALTAAVVWMIFSNSTHRNRIMRSLHARVPSRFAGLADATLEALASFAGRRWLLSQTLLLSLGMQVLIIVQYYFISEALGFPVPLQDYVLFIPIAVIVMMIPVSINAIGLREGLFVFFLSTYDIGTSEALAFIWLLYARIAITGLMGGAVYLFGKGSATKPSTGLASDTPGNA